MRIVFLEGTDNMDDVAVVIVKFVSCAVQTYNDGTTSKCGVIRVLDGSDVLGEMNIFRFFVFRGLIFGRLWSQWSLKRLYAFGGL